MSAEVDDILSQIPMNTLAAQLGVDEATAEQAARAAIPSPARGHASQRRRRAVALANAVSPARPLAARGGVLASVDTADGQAIMNRIFGGNTDKCSERSVPPTSAAAP